MYRDFRWTVLGLFFTALAVGVTGCWEKKVDVTGMVTYNGSPLNKPGGKIVFIGPNETQVVASIGADGAYRATGVLFGPNRVAVFYPNPEFKAKKRLPTKGQEPGAFELPDTPFLTPDKYASVTTSDLSIQAARGTVFDANLIGQDIQ
jgi:hypothetical protein